MGEKRSSTTCFSVMVGVWFALFAQIVNFDMVSNILYALFCQRFSKSCFNGGSHETRNSPLLQQSRDREFGNC